MSSCSQSPFSSLGRPQDSARPWHPGPRLRPGQVHLLFWEPEVSKAELLFKASPGEGKTPEVQPSGCWSTLIWLSSPLWSREPPPWCLLIWGCPVPSSWGPSSPVGLIPPVFSAYMPRAELRPMWGQHVIQGQSPPEHCSPGPHM